MTETRVNWAMVREQRARTRERESRTVVEADCAMCGDYITRRANGEWSWCSCDKRDAASTGAREVVEFVGDVG